MCVHTHEENNTNEAKMELLTRRYGNADTNAVYTVKRRAPPRICGGDRQSKINRVVTLTKMASR